MKHTLLTVLVFSALLSFAAQTQASAPSAASEAGHGEHKAELLHWDIGSALWSIAVFVILLVILRVAAWKPILAGLNQRENFIRDSLSQAKHEREAAERMMAEYKAKIEESHQEATAIVEEGRRDAEELRKRIQGEAKSEAEAIVARAKKDIELARDEAIKSMHDQSVMLATAVAGKLIKRELSAADHQALLNESLAELSKMN
ncbi:MAG: F0F1 ATP synthase subunit B [Phycisphaerae bacterium]|nr:F0F1 ATP synthase subunit B [Phycisphaerae bacterium]